ncbi:CbtB-domain containing protein [Alphaproteobacteria bacterium GH1-50]|uniref:CbtB-domain containing protein n=1 Tax=Kangsaoukella pontilimi TaxID=2691042 RepID=A0A7C9II27_9RHOB|nr:CbtB domain-containing protein [Kangsaoukella pontilimi]MXQ09067.1 CbtB-domain containing protein [Kangsaoukella pontilimi]
MATSEIIEPGRKLGLGGLAVMILLGLGIVFASGHANALHDAAHDMRHALGFPCH